jgi:hypothetical protein
MNASKHGMVLLLMMAFSMANAQMNFEDSSVQVITYWNLGETHEYSVSLHKLQYTANDTTSNETITYDVEVSVVDSSLFSYNIRWYYKNFKSDSESPVLQKLATAAEGMEVIILTNEVGSFQGIVNIMEISDYMTNSINALRADFEGQSALDKVFDQMLSIYADNTSIEARTMEDIRQFHTFYGSQYILNETITAPFMIYNPYDLNQFLDTYESIRLENLDGEHNEYKMRFIQEVNPVQFTEATYIYRKEMAKSSGDELIERADFNNCTKIVETVSRIHNTGWLIESIQWNEVVANGTTNLETRRIHVK